MVPHSVKKFKRQAFLDWLEAKGAELCDITNPYEIARYRKMEVGDNRHTINIIYKRKDDSLTYCGNSIAHYTAFLKDQIK